MNKTILSGLGAAALIGLIGVLNTASPTPKQPASVVQSNGSVAGDASQTKPGVKTETVAEVIPFKTVTIQDNTLPKGQTVVTMEGANGERLLTYEVTYSDGEEASRDLVSGVITKSAVDRVIHVGTYVPPPKPKPSCDPNYSGCVPIASDVDCADGNGNGPAYVSGPVRVIGTDIYRLDGDGDGWGCE